MLPGARASRNATGLLALTAIPAAVLGGLDSTAGAVVGGLIIGVARRSRPATRTSWRSSAAGSSEVGPYVVMLLVLLWRPSGLFGTQGGDPCLSAPAMRLRR